jgi:hypothetical protein
MIEREKDNIMANQVVSHEYRHSIRIQERKKRNIFPEKSKLADLEARQLLPKRFTLSSIFCGKNTSARFGL